MGFENLKKYYDGYEVTKEGEVISKRLKTPLKKKIDNVGYYRVRLYHEGIPKDIRVHRLVALFYVEGYSENKVVNHIDGNKLNNHYDNLEWVTLSENNHHAYANWLTPRGEKTLTAKMSESEALEVIRLLSEGVSVREINRLIPNSTKSSVEKIRSGDNWRHLQR